MHVKHDSNLGQSPRAGQGGSQREEPCIQMLAQGAWKGARAAEPTGCLPATAAQARAGEAATWPGSCRPRHCPANWWELWKGLPASDSYSGLCMQGRQLPSMALVGMLRGLAG
eukprot:scaffold38635_cov23-Tisochrysis_lutea.AAC.2